MRHLVEEVVSRLTRLGLPSERVEVARLAFRLTEPIDSGRSGAVASAAATLRSRNSLIRPLLPGPGATFQAWDPGPLYSRYGVPYYWIVDPEARTVEAHVLAERGYQFATRAAGLEALSLPPFSDLAFVPASLWS